MNWRTIKQEWFGNVRGDLLAGKGDARLAIAATPVLLLSQMVLLPAWLWLFLGGELAGVVRAGNFLEAFLGLIVLPLVLVALTEAAARRSKVCARWLQFTARLPVPLLALTVLLIAGAQIRAISGSWGLLGATAAVFIAFAVIVPFPARFVARRFGRRPPNSARLLSAPAPAIRSWSCRSHSLCRRAGNSPPP